MRIIIVLCFLLSGCPHAPYWYPMKIQPTEDGGEHFVLEPWPCVSPVACNIIINGVAISYIRADLPKWLLECASRHEARHRPINGPAMDHYRGPSQVWECGDD